MHVGLPFMKLSLSPSTQKHNGKKAGTCSVKAAWDEMRDVRRGRDETIDRSMTDQNVWLCGSTEMDLEAEIQKYIDQVNAAVSCFCSGFQTTPQHVDFVRSWQMLLI